MDQAFFIRARRLLDLDGVGRSEPAPLDHATLVAAIAARQAATPTARAASRCRPAADGADEAALVTLVLGGDGWREAAAKRCFCFNRAATARPLNTL